MSDETVIATRARRTVGKYRIDGVLGKGSMGIVYAGHDPDLDRAVAIKTVHPHLIAAAGEEDWLERFAREARAAGRVLHPNLVAVFDYLQQDGQPYLVMERLRPSTLEDRMVHGPALELGTVHAILDQMLAGLSQIHAAGIVHRDLKPANVMLTDGGGVKLTDFGIARLTRMSATGAGMIGTPAYMAPEQFVSGGVDARADIYACGVLLYELVTGRKPYEGGGVEALLAAVRQGGAAAPSSLVPGLSPEHDALILTAMSADPADRFAEARAMREALRHALPPLKLDATMVVGTPRRPAETALSETMLQRLSSDTLVAVERQLIDRIGPVGRVILRRAAARARTPDEMVGAVLKELAAGGEQEAMRETILRLLSARAGPSAAGIPDLTLQRLAALLLPALGPIATVLTKRAAAKATSLADLVRRLAVHLDDAGERAGFLEAAGSLGDTDDR